MYVFIFGLWTAHVMNIHIVRQWKYVNDLLLWMMEKDGVDHVESIMKEGRRGAIGLMKRAI